MKVNKRDLVKAIDRLKSVVQKNERIRALEGILVKDGYLTASNTELTIQVKLEAAEGEYFIIPMKSFDLIKNLPDGEIDIVTNEKHIVKIQTGKIKNSYQSYDPETFSYEIKAPEEKGIKLPGKKLMNALSHVIYAAADKSPNKAMTGICFDGKEGELRLVALDGHGIAVDVIPLEYKSEIKIIIPKMTIKKLQALEIDGEIELSYDGHCAVFKAKEYIVYTRLLEEKYFPYEKLFMPYDNIATVEKRMLLEAIERGKVCTDGSSPVVLTVFGQELNLHICDSTTDYHENISLQKGPIKGISIGFSPSLLCEAIKSFPDEKLNLDFNSPKQPVMISSVEGKMKALVLPVMMRG